MMNWNECGRKWSCPISIYYILRTVIISKHSGDSTMSSKNVQVTTKFNLHVKLS